MKYQIILKDGQTIDCDSYELTPSFLFYKGNLVNGWVGRNDVAEFWDLTTDVKEDLMHLISEI